MRRSLRMAALKSTVLTWHKYGLFASEIMKLMEVLIGDICCCDPSSAGNDNKLLIYCGGWHWFDWSQTMGGASWNCGGSATATGISVILIGRLCFFILILPISPDMYVRIYGRLNNFNNRINCVAFSIRPVTDFNEISYHFLDAIHTHLTFTKASPVRRTWQLER